MRLPSIADRTESDSCHVRKLEGLVARAPSYSYRRDANRKREPFVHTQLEEINNNHYLRYSVYGLKNPGNLYRKANCFS